MTVKIDAEVADTLVTRLGTTMDEIELAQADVARCAAKTAAAERIADELEHERTALVAFLLNCGWNKNELLREANRRRNSYNTENEGGSDDTQDSEGTEQRPEGDAPDADSAPEAGSRHRYLGAGGFDSRGSGGSRGGSSHLRGGQGSGGTDPVRG